MEVDDTREEEGREEDEENGSPLRNIDLMRHSSEEPDSPTGDDIHFSLPEEEQGDGLGDGSPSFNDPDHLSLSDH